MTQHATVSNVSNVCSFPKLMGPGKLDHIGPVGKSVSKYGMSSTSPNSAYIAFF